MKRILIAGLALCMLLLLLSACGESVGPEVTTAATTAAEVELNALPAGVEYKEAYELQGDPGDNLSAPDAAIRLFKVLRTQYEDYYTPGDAVTITLTDLEFVNGSECYLYSVKSPGGESHHAVDYGSGTVYVRLDGEYFPISEESIAGGPVHVTDAETAEIILQDAIQALTEEMAANGDIALVARGEDTINGRKAWLYALGADTPEKFTAEYLFAVTDYGEVLVMDILAEGKYVPYAVG